jgi:hypothetical protein
MRFRKKKVSAAQQSLEAAERSLADAKADYGEQARKRAAEQALIMRLERLAEGNHLAELVLRAMTERHSGSGGQRA